MAIRLEDQYPGRTEPADANYPDGSFKNETTPTVPATPISAGSNDGTPLDKEWANDKEGFFQALLSEGGVTPSGTPDTSVASQNLLSAKKVLNSIALEAVEDAANTYSVDIAATLEDGQVYEVVFPTLNTGAATLNGKSVVTYADAALTGGEISITRPTNLRYDLGNDWYEIVRREFYDYEVILAFGTYTSGTFALPGGKTWSDYRAVSVVQRVSGTDIFSQAMVTEEILGLGAFVIRPDVDASDSAGVTRSSATQFTVSRTGNDSIAQVIGWVK